MAAPKQGALQSAPYRRDGAAFSTYLAELGAERLPDAALFRTRSGVPYSDAKLSTTFRMCGPSCFPGDRRRLMDMRRSGSVEAIAGGADALSVAAKMANSIGRSNALHKAYAPVSLEAVRGADEARFQGRRKMRTANVNSAPRRSVN